MGRLLNSTGQGTPEFSVVVGFVVLIFLIIVLVVFQKQSEAFNFQVSIDAKKVTTTIADNINMLAQNGHGYYRYFSVPEQLYGLTNYTINVDGNSLWISYLDETWSVQLLTNDIAILNLTKGEDKQNCAINLNGHITINKTCALP